MHAVKGGLVFGSEGAGPRFGAEELDIETPLAGMRPTGIPSLRVAGGEASPLPQLALTGIAGVIGPPPAGVAGAAAGLVIDLRGSYGGAHEALWTAKGHAEPAHGDGQASLRADQFSLGRIADVLPQSVLTPENTTLDAALDLDWLGDAVKFGGELAVVGLSLQSDALAADPVQNVSLGIDMHGTVYPLARRLELEQARGAGARRDGAPLRAHRHAGRNVPVHQRQVAERGPRHRSAFLGTPRGAAPSCSPASQRAGAAAAGVRAAGDLRRGGRREDRLRPPRRSGSDRQVGIDGCKVVKAPDDVKALAHPETLVINVDVPKLPGSPAGETDTSRWSSAPTTRTSRRSSRSRPIWSGRS